RRALGGEAGEAGKAALTGPARHREADGHVGLLAARRLQPAPVVRGEHLVGGAALAGPVLAGTVLAGTVLAGTALAGTARADRAGLRHHHAGVRDDVTPGTGGQ